MPEQTPDLSRLVSATTNRLRLVQIDFADQSAETRDAYLTEELQMVLAQIPSDQRPGFLQQLKERFPSWQPKANITVPNPPAPTATESTPAAQTEWPAQPLKALKTKLQLTDRDQIDAARLLELTAELVAFTSSLDQLLWATWKQVSPKSDMKRPAPLQRTLARFVSGDAEVARPAVAADIDRLRQLTAGLISAIAQAGNLFAQKHVGKFSPANIETYAEKATGAMGSKEAKCWRQYKELATAMDVQSIELELQSAIAEYTESLIKGRTRTA